MLTFEKHDILQMRGMRCEREDTGGLHMGNVIILLLIFIVCIFAVKSYIGKLQNGCCGAGGDGVKKEVPLDGDKSHYAHRYVLSVEGMSCKNCANHIENVFNKKEGFYAEVNLRQKKAQVWTREEVEEAVLRVEIARAGYECTGVEKLQ